MLHSLRPQDVNSKLEVHYYCIGGEEIECDSPRVLAKKMVGRTTKYFCKANTYGIEAGHLVNPWSMFSDEAVTAQNKNPTNNRTGKRLQEYVEVPQIAFELYLRYLTTRSDVHYRQAERMVLENV